MAQTPHVHNGYLQSWLNYDRHYWRRQVTVSDTKASFITAAVVVLLALATPAAYLILNRIIVRTWEWLHTLQAQRQALQASRLNQGPPDFEDVEANEETPLRPKVPRCSYQSRIRETWKSSTTPDFALIKLGQLGWEMLTHGPEELADANTLHNDFERSPNSLGEFRTGFKKSNLKARLPEIFLLVFLFLFCLVAFGLLIWGSIAAGNIVSDSVALLDGKDCGFWIPDSSAPRKTNGTYGHFYLQELEAGEYAKKCYGTREGVDGCSSFVSQDLPYSVTHNALCPFSDELCLNGRYSALTLSTPLISSKSLGINVPIGFTFNRTTTCAPLKRVGFVKEREDVFEYNYGAVKWEGNATWTSPKQKLKTAPGYEVATICYEEDLGSRNFWEPLPAFQSYLYGDTTILFIQSQNNYHRFPSSDPIFPANSPLDPPKSIPLFTNEDPIATILACVDQLTICTHDGQTCWTDINNPTEELDSHAEKTGYYMLDIALQHSNVCNSIGLLGGSSLDATTKVPFSPTLPISLPLDVDQWKIEVRALFETSLARIQIDLRDHMQGAAKNEIGFANHIDSAFMDMCASYKFRTVGWRNVNVWAFRMLLLLVVCVYLLSFEAPWSKEPQLVVEALWDSTVLKFLYWQGWMPMPRGTDSNIVVQNNDVGMHIVGDDAGQELAPQHVIGDDEDEDENNK